MKIRSKLRLPRRRLGSKRQLQRLRIEAESADVVHGSEPEHALLDVHVLLELRLELLEGGFLAREVVVRLLKVLEVQKAVLGVRVQVRLHLILQPVHGTREKQDELDDLDVAGDLVVEGPSADVIVIHPGNVLLVAVQVGVAPASESRDSP